FPAETLRQWHACRGLDAYSCGGSAGIAPASLSHRADEPSMQPGRALSSLDGQPPRGPMGQYEVSVASIVKRTAAIRELVLRAKDGAGLPAYAPGAHVEIDVTLNDGSEAMRGYSLLGGTLASDDPPDTYRIAVERRAEGAGGARFLCERGGIGIAPIYAMARRLKREGLPFALAYLAPDKSQMAYREESEALTGGRAILHAESNAAEPLDVKALVQALTYPSEVYVCGTYALNQAVVAA